MILVLKFRANDLNPSKGKQIEFSPTIVREFFKFTNSEEHIQIAYKSSEGKLIKTIECVLRLSPARGDYKIYQNEDGSADLKDLFLETLHLNSGSNLEDYFVLKKNDNSHYEAYYYGKNTSLVDFYKLVSKSDNVVFVDESGSSENEGSSVSTRNFIANDHSSILYLNSLRTKPFLLLAGISGTGKSQKVQELAFMTCPKELREENSTTPGNYCLIEVKPNWHDSTELLGYYSSLSGKYELTKFVRFAYKAIQNPNTPFFVCLDEMNLAPVEQYFAEYLSVLETRKRIYNEDTKKYEIHTEPLLDKDVFAPCEFTKTEAKPKPNSYLLDTNTYTQTVNLYDAKDKSIIEFLKANGLHIPENLFVIGTVNMDDTTHQFSRKVIDRAFTIEMNGGKMEDMFSPQSKMALEYRDKPVKLEEFKSEFVKAYEVLEDSRFAKYQPVIAIKIPALLGDSDGHAEEGSLNGILNKTPFRVSYRVQNELVLYLSTLIERAGFPNDIEPLIGEAFLAILLEKVLPRIQGEAKQLETKDGKSNILKDMMGFVKEKFSKSVSVEQQPEGTEDTDAIDLFAEVASNEDKPAPSTNLYDQIITKLDEMDKKLTGYYTNFF